MYGKVKGSPQIRIMVLHANLGVRDWVVQWYTGVRPGPSIVTAQAYISCRMMLARQSDDRLKFPAEA